jgi:hypothetical protein
MKENGTFLYRLFHKWMRFQVLHLEPDIFPFNQPVSFLDLLRGGGFFDFGIPPHSTFV